MGALCVASSVYPGTLEYDRFCSIQNAQHGVWHLYAPNLGQSLTVYHVLEYQSSIKKLAGISESFLLYAESINYHYNTGLVVSSP